MHCILRAIAFVLFCTAAGSVFATDTLPTRVLIVDGRNNHDWRITTDSLRATLLQTNLFEVDVSTAPGQLLPAAPRTPRTEDQAALAKHAEAALRHREAFRELQPKADALWQAWSPKFSQYDVVVLNYNGPRWNEKMQADFLKFVKDGGGVVLVHAANNAFGDWDEFNKLIGLGWRKAGFGKALKVNPDTSETFVASEKENTTTPLNSGHGSKHSFVVIPRETQHPIMKGLPPRWKHGSDELYHHMRGPAENLTILSSAYSAPEQRGVDMHEPITWEVKYGEGRVIVTTMGHFWPQQTNWDSLHCVGFQTVFARSVEYAGTGDVSLDVPTEFPQGDNLVIKPPHRINWQVGGKNTRFPAKERSDWQAKKEANEFAVLSPEQERESFVLAEGFEIDVAAAEPAVQEPVLTVWDGNGVMYVAEMRSYMQTETGEGTKSLKNGRVKRLEDVDGDGVYEKVTIFIDNLNLPRMILPLDDRIAVAESDDLSVWSYRDTNGDGVADEKHKLYQGKVHPPEKSVEHQDSGLIWNLNNWIYISYGAERYRFTDGEWKAEKLLGHWAQWGLDHDDEGRIFYTHNSAAMVGAQMPREYWGLIAHRSGSGGLPGDPISLGEPHNSRFLVARNICERDDRGGAAGPRKSFTSLCGQSFFRGHAMPHDVRGNYFFTDPTIHVVRRSQVSNVNGRMMLTHPYGDDEFLLSSDFYFRPVNTATGPDGCLYITDMYRGIIQDAGWWNDASRKFSRESGTVKTIQNGRIWRVSHRDHLPSGRPRMLDESTLELLRHFEHPNGWWRDTAQKLIILREDRDIVVPHLEDLVRYHQNPITRLHALWTLEGCDAIELTLLQEVYTDRDPRLRAAAIKMTEPWVRGKDTSESTLEILKPLLGERDPEVARQLILTIGWSNETSALPMIEKIIEKHLAHEGVFLAGATALWKTDTPFVQKIRSGEAFASISDAAQRQAAYTRWTEGLAQWSRELTLPESMPKIQRDQVKRGEKIYYQSCVGCHGSDGKGVQNPALPKALAPPLAGSKRVTGPIAGPVLVLSHGFEGPIDGVAYQSGYMASAKALHLDRDDRISEVISYIRYAWGNNGSAITKDEVTQIRRGAATRKKAWTSATLDRRLLPELTERKGWQGDSVHGDDSTNKLLLEGKPWTAGQQTERWIGIDLGTIHTLSQVAITAPELESSARRCDLLISSDKKSWTRVGENHHQAEKTRFLLEPVVCRYVKIVQPERDATTPWKISKVAVYGVVGELPELPPEEEGFVLPPMAELLKAKGNGEEGRAVYKQHCAKCHQYRGQGDAVGPDLSEVGKRLKREQIFQSILDPSAVIDKKYGGVSIIDLAGRVHTGLITKETTEVITLVGLDGKAVEIPVSEVDERIPQKTSVMPAGFERQVDLQGLLDVVQFLSE